MEKQEKRPVGGIHLQVFSYIIAAAALLISGVLLFACLRIGTRYTELLADTDRLLKARQDARDMQNASDFLTKQAQNYVVTEEWQRVLDFFEESEQSRRREKALEGLMELEGDQDALQYLSRAMEHSRELMQSEYKAMCLILAANGEEHADLPEVLAQTELTPEEQAMTPEEQRALARELVFGEEYQKVKEEIGDSVQSCTDRLMNLSRENQQDSEDRLRKTLYGQQGLIALLLAVMLLFVVVIISQAVHPILTEVRLVRDGLPMKETGAYEIRFLAENYNDIFARNLQDKEQLSYEATHDPLTGLYNRKAYEQALGSCDQSRIALILVDVDRFKGVNDTYGHEVGDHMLQRVAGALQVRFRSEDYVCRIGGDEFAVLMMNTTSALTDLVAEKMRSLARELSVPQGDVPAATLSIGIAFGDRKAPKGTLFQDADRTLYDVKERGRSGFAVFGETV